MLLLIQQGPGLPMINEARRFEHVLGLEQAFTVVYWDQRGCGRSLRRQKDRVNLSLERMVGDTVSLLDILRDRFWRFRRQGILDGLESTWKDRREPRKIVGRAGSRSKPRTATCVEAGPKGRVRPLVA